MSDTPETHAPVTSLAAALAAAIADCEAVAPDKQNEFHRYKYASAEAIMQEAHRVMAKHGLSLVPVERTWHRTELPPHDAPAAYACGELCSVFMLCHVSGETMRLEHRFPYVIEKGRPEDKAVATAMTAQLKYLLRDLLLIPRIDDEEEMDTRADDSGGKGAARPPQSAGPSRESAKSAEVESPCVIVPAKVEQVYTGKMKSGHDYSIHAVESDKGKFKLFDSRGGADGKRMADLIGKPVRVEWVPKTSPKGYTDREIKTFDPASESNATGTPAKDVRDDEVEVVMLATSEAVQNKEGVTWYKLRGSDNTVYWCNDEKVAKEALKIVSQGLRVRCQVTISKNQVFLNAVSAGGPIESGIPAPSADDEVPF